MRYLSAGLLLHLSMEAVALADKATAPESWMGSNECGKNLSRTQKQPPKKGADKSPLSSGWERSESPERYN